MQIVDLQKNSHFHRITWLLCIGQRDKEKLHISLEYIVTIFGIFVNNAVVGIIISLHWELFVYYESVAVI